MLAATLHAEVTTAPADLPLAARIELDSRLSEGRMELPLLPSTALEVGRHAADEQADLRQLAELIKRDQALTTHLLRVVNSPLYAPRSPIVSLHQAVARLGASKIRELCLLIAFRVGIFKSKSFASEVQAVFSHATTAALFAQEIARATRRNVEEAFLAGLLHDVGRPVLLQAAVSVLGDSAALHRAAILEYTDREHGRAGAMLARSWGLPATLSVTLEHHHSAEPPSEIAAVRLVQLADDLAHFAQHGTRDRSALEQHPALEALELYADTLQAILDKSKSVLAVAEALS